MKNKILSIFNEEFNLKQGISKFDTFLDYDIKGNVITMNDLPRYDLELTYLNSIRLKNFGRDRINSNLQFKNGINIIHDKTDEPVINNILKAMEFLFRKSNKFKPINGVVEIVLQKGANHIEIIRNLNENQYTYNYNEIKTITSDRKEI